MEVCMAAKIASLQGATFGIQFKSPAAGDFSPVSPFSPLHAFLDISAQKGHTCRLKMLLQIKNCTCKLKILPANIVHAN